MNKPWTTNKLPLRLYHFPSLEDPYRVLPTVGFQALQINTSKKQFVATRKVPLAEFRFIEMPAR